MPTITERIQNVQSLIESAAQKSGRKLEDITLVGVTKGVSSDRIAEAAQAGLKIFGENKIQEAEEKIPQVTHPDLEWQMIGHLQSNKITKALSFFNLIQSVDSIKLAKKINEESASLEKVTDVLLEVNISGESQKYGFAPEAIYTAIEAMADFENIRVLGLMGMAPFEVDDEEKRAAFKNLKGLFSVCKCLPNKNVQMKYLSMGMSDDFEMAVEEGANMVRLGRVLFK